MAALSPWVWFVGYAGLVALTFVFPNPILILILLLGGYESWRRWKARNTPEARAFHAIPTRTRVLVAVVYLGLAAALAVGVAETFLEKRLRRRLSRSRAPACAAAFGFGSTRGLRNAPLLPLHPLPAPHAARRRRCRRASTRDGLSLASGRGPGGSAVERPPCRGLREGRSARSAARACSAAAQEDPQVMSVRLGVLDGDPAIRPESRQHVASAAAVGALDPRRRSAALPGRASLPGADRRSRRCSASHGCTSVAGLSSRGPLYGRVAQGAGVGPLVRTRPRRPSSGSTNLGLPSAAGGRRTGCPSAPTARAAPPSSRGLPRRSRCPPCPRSAAARFTSDAGSVS